MKARPKNVRRPNGHCPVHQMTSPCLFLTDGLTPLITALSFLFLRVCECYLQVTPASKAAQGDLCPGDTILAINGDSTELMTHMEAQNKIKTCTQQLALSISRYGNENLTRDTTLRTAFIFHYDTFHKHKCRRLPEQDEYRNKNMHVFIHIPWIHAVL